MAIVLRSLSDFKRFLRKPGATIQIVRNTLIDRQSPEAREAYRRKGMFEPRTVRALSKKAAVFGVGNHDTTVWLYWDKGTRHWRYSGDTVTVPLDAGVGPPDEVTYRCSLPEERAKPQPKRVRVKDDLFDRTEPAPAF